MTHKSNTVTHTHAIGSVHGRVKVEEMDTGLALGLQFRSYIEIIKPSAEVWYLRFTTPIPVYLQGVTAELDSGAARVSSWGSTAISGTWTPVPISGRNRNPARAGYPNDSDAPYVGQATVSKAIAGTGIVTGGTETNVRRARCALNQGSNSSSSTASFSLLQIIPAGDYIIKVEPITGFANADTVNGILILYWEELPGGAML